MKYLISQTLDSDGIIKSEDDFQILLLQYDIGGHLTRANDGKVYFEVDSLTRRFTLAQRGDR